MLLFVLLFGVGHIALAQFTPYYFFDASSSPNSKLNNYIEVLTDTSKKMDIGDIVASDNFKPYLKTTKLLSKYDHWATMKIKNGFDTEKEIIVQIGGKRNSDFSTIYVFNRNDSLIKEAVSGHFTPGHKKDVKNELGSKFLLSLEANEIQTLYFRIQNISGFDPKFDVQVYEKAHLDNNVDRRNMVQGMLQGAFWIMFLYNLFIFLYSKDRVYFYYSLYIIGLAINFVVERGMFVEYIIPGNPKIEPFVFVLATGLATIAYFQFIRYFLGTKKQMPKWDKAHLWVVRINLFVTIGLLLALVISFNIPLSINLSNYMNLLGLIYGFVFIGSLIKKENKLSRFFIAGALALAIGTIISLYFLMTKETLSFDPKFFMNGGTILEILFFSLGLGQRIKLNEAAKQEVQAKLIDQLKRNDRLKEKAKQELEGKVKQRTAEIAQQNEEIQAQADNLKLANDILIQQKREIEQKTEEITQQKSVLEKVHKSTTDSINYASRIQNVILPTESVLEKYFTSHFVFFKPREMVSGDFYWYRYIERQNKRYFALVAADATGHGVPGSLVSMLGISLLNETVVRNEVNAANEVLEILREEVKTTFSQSQEQLLTRDGIDMAFCMIDLDTLEMQFSGANRPLLLFRENGTKNGQDPLNNMVEVKPTKNPVGLYRKEQPFKNHIIQLKKGDIIYLFSDGYVDQVGGPDGRKFYLRRFKDLLANIYTRPMEEQREIVVKAHDYWTSHKFRETETFKQVDDILVMGIKI